MDKLKTLSALDASFLYLETRSAASSAARSTTWC